MKIKNNPKLLLILLFTSYTSFSQNFHLVKDINAVKSSSPSNPGRSGFAVLKDTACFIADDGSHGSELWKSDGTLQGTKMIKDIIPGPTSGDIRNIVAAADRIYFQLTQPSSGTEIWESDGTSGGTGILKDVNPGAGSSYPTLFSVIDNLLYFSASDGLNGYGLWRTDGTDSGTFRIRSFADGNPSAVVKMDSTIFFMVTSSDLAYGGLWKTDGTDTGTHKVFDLDSYLPSFLSEAGGKLFFVDSDEGALWTSDGTTIGTRMINKVLPGLNFTRPYFTAMDSIIYFTGYDVSNGLALWRSDGTDSGTYLIKDINPGPDVNIPITSLTLSLNKIYFFADGGNGNFDLWSTDGTAEGTLKIKSLGFENLAPNINLTNVNGTLFFSGYTASHGYELWKSDGTTGGTQEILDIATGIYSSSPSYITGVKNLVLFNANDQATGFELWKTDGTTGGTTLISDINVNGASASAYPSGLTPFNDKLYFIAYNEKYGNELWKTDGTEQGTLLVRDIQQGSFEGANYGIPPLPTAGANMYFTAQTLDYGNEFWKSDGTSDGTAIVRDITPGRLNSLFDFDYNGIHSVSNINDTFYFSGHNYSGYGANYTGSTLFRTDANQGAFAVKTLTYGIDDLTAAGHLMFFDEYNSYYGWELWRSDGTEQGTFRIEEIHPEPFSLFSFKSNLFFRNIDGYMWISDGSFSGTKLFKNIAAVPYGDFYTAQWKSYPGYVLFAALDAINGQELWKSDGTPEGTVLIKDINPGSGGSYPRSFVAAGNLLYFLANDNEHGTELWRSDGTAGGTQLIKDISAGSASSVISSLVKVGDKLCFLLTDQFHNSAIWQTDGTENGTFKIVDNNLNNLVIYDWFGSALQAVGDKLFFAAENEKYGLELWVGTLQASLPLTLINFNGRRIKSDALLEWTTLNEQKFSHFNLQRSTDNIHFKTIKRINATGSLNLKTSYQYLDDNITSLGSNKIYYRLEQVDKDNKTTLSKIVLIEINGESITCWVRPNPVNSMLQISINGIIESQRISLNITNSQGKTVLSESRNVSAGSNLISCNCSSWAAGIYVLNIVLADGTKRDLKIIKQ